MHNVTILYTPWADSSQVSDEESKVMFVNGIEIDGVRLYWIGNVAAHLNVGPNHFMSLQLWGANVSESLNDQLEDLDGRLLDPNTWTAGIAVRSVSFRQWTKDDG